MEFTDWLLTIGPYHWLALAALLIGIEMIMPTQYLMWPGIAAAVVGLIAAVTDLGWVTEFVIYAVLSTALILASRLLPKSTQPHPNPTLNQRTDQMVGRTATVAEDFIHGQGAVLVGDTRWSAATTDGSDLASGARVEIVAADSTLLKVKKAG